MIEIKAGVELDRAVAEIIGIQTMLDDGKVVTACREWDDILEELGTQLPRGTWRIPFQPSTDLNAAFAAAEKAGLFHQDTDAFLCRTPYGKRGSGEEWKVWREQDGKLRFECSHHGSTPALAICAAILKLKGYSDVTDRYNSEVKPDG